MHFKGITMKQSKNFKSKNEPIEKETENFVNAIFKILYKAWFEFALTDVWGASSIWKNID